MWSRKGNVIFCPRSTSFWFFIDCLRWLRIWLFYVLSTRRTTIQQQKLHRKSACGNYATFLCCFRCCQQHGRVRFFLSVLRWLLQQCFMHETDININKCQSFYFFYTFFAFFVAICCLIFCLLALADLSMLVFCGVVFVPFRLVFYSAAQDYKHSAFQLGLPFLIPQEWQRLTSFAIMKPW